MLEDLYGIRDRDCACGRGHRFDTLVVIEDAAIERLPALLSGKGYEKLFMLADANTYRAAGKEVEKKLESAGFSVRAFVFGDARPEPSDKNVGRALVSFDADCDAIVTVGSGVLNDVGKIIANAAKKPCCTVGTAPSMDGYASATSSMIISGIKTTVQSKCPDIIVCDLNVMKNAPLKMMISGLGDMLAKYVSVCEWRIAHIITGEYYCESVAELVRRALARCVENADDLLSRDEKAVAAVTEGLVLSGAAMNFAGVSRPASGVEHYISHVWDMRAAAFGTPSEPHGIQCAVGTLAAVRIYEKLKSFKPDKAKAAAYHKAFDLNARNAELRAFLGAAAESMISAEEKDRKYDPAACDKRFDVICAHWDEILGIIDEELPDGAELEALLTKLGAPKTCADIGLDPGIMLPTFAATRDIRDKYVLSRLCFDLGIDDPFAL